MTTDDGIQAISGGKPVEPAAVEAYPAGKFGDALGAVREAMRKLAQSCAPAVLFLEDCPLYGRFRPPRRASGVGGRGDLEIGLIA